MSDSSLSQQVARLLESDAPAAAEPHLVPCNAGGNNRVFIVTAGERRFIAKWYFSHASDRRDRLHAEFTFLRYAERAGIQNVPRPISCDLERRLAIYEYIDGAPIGVVSQPDVDAAVRFFLALNESGCRHLATQLPDASEACFSIRDQFTLIDSRIERLRAGIPATAGVDADAQTFARDVQTTWDRLKAHITAKAPTLGISVENALPADQRCISPSDFGFHNALRRPSGEVCFLDFEYAGWDDPAKLVGDFLSHPAVPVHDRFRAQVIDQAMTFCANGDALRARAWLLLPVFQIKWCCIMLNDFLPNEALRRRFADADFDEAHRKAVQLDKARRLFSSIEKA
jgi:hypothetical protein